MRALVLCHGDPPSESLLRREVARADLVLCTDGVAVWLEGRGILPDFIVGDLDSLGPATVAAPVLDAGPHDQQANSDSEKAVLLALSRGADEVTLLGAAGGRLDHTLANVALCVRYLDDARLRILDDTAEMQVILGRRELHVSPGARISLVALTPDAVIRTAGLQWELSEPLLPGTRGLSNVAVAERITLDVTAGLVAAFIFHEAD